jgi:hypothetical protein
MRFSVWISKSIAPVWCFGPQNYHDDFLLWVSKPCMLWFFGCATKPTGGYFGVGHSSRSGGLLLLEASRARVFQSDLKTDGCVMMSGACGIYKEVASRES